MSVHLLEAISFVDLLGIGMLIPLLPNYVRKMGGNHIHVGLLGSIYAGFQLGSGPLIGSLSDIKGRRVILMYTLACSGLAYSLVGFCNSIAMILLLRAFLGLCKQTQILTRALVPDIEKNVKKQSVIFGKIAATSGIGITIGPIIGGHIAEDYPENGLKITALLVGVCFAVNFGMVYMLPEPKPAPKENKNMDKETVPIIKVVTSSVKQSVAEFYDVQWKLYWQIFLLKAITGFSMALHYSNYALFLKTAYSLSPKYIGYVISFQGLIGSLSCYFMGYVNKLYDNDHDFSLRNFHVFVIMTISLLGFIISSNILMYVFWLLPLAIGNAVGRLVTLEMILNKGNKKHRGILIGASNSTRSLSGVIAPMVAGFIAHYVGVAYVVYVSLLFTLIGTFISYNIRRSKQSKSKHD